MGFLPKFLAVIPAGETESQPLDLRGHRLLGVRCAESFMGGAVSVRVSEDGVSGWAQALNPAELGFTGRRAATSSALEPAWPVGVFVRIRIAGPPAAEDRAFELACEAVA